jgi:hypothetical protein
VPVPLSGYGYGTSQTQGNGTLCANVNVSGKVGDLLIAVVRFDEDGSGAEMSAPANWTRYLCTGATPYEYVFYHQIAVNDGSSWSFPYSGTSGGYSVLVCDFTVPNGMTAINLVSTNESIVSWHPAATTSLNVTLPPVIVYGGGNSNNTLVTFFTGTDPNFSDNSGEMLVSQAVPAGGMVYYYLVSEGLVTVSSSNYYQTPSCTGTQSAGSYAGSGFSLVLSNN